MEERRLTLLRDACSSAAVTRCPHFPACPGCPWFGRPYLAQLAAKRDRVVTALGDALSDAAPTVVAAVMPAAEQTGYRVQAKLMLGPARSGLAIGLYAPGTHHVLDISGCPLHDPLIARALPIVRTLVLRERVPIHGPGHRGLRYLLVRASVAERRLLVTLVSSLVPLMAAPAITRGLRAALPLAGLLVNENASAGNVIVGPRTKRIWGAAELRDRYGDVELVASPVAFVQANTRMAATIYRTIATAAALRGSERVLDLYCGVGGIALTLAASAARVLAIEEVPAAVQAARANARRNHRHNVRVEVGRVEEHLDALAGFAPDVVTLNPPRRGCGTAVAAALVRARVPQLLYLSCDPTSFARDAAVLVGGGYRLRSVQPFDLMPQTEQVELLGAFDRGDAGPRRRSRRDEAVRGARGGEWLAATA